MKYLALTKEEIINELVIALHELVCCPAFTSELFEKDKESHKAWTLARYEIKRANDCLNK
jgi:hypothetical protein